MLRQIWEHDLLITLVRNKDMAGRFDNRSSFESSERSNLGPVAENLVAKGATLAAGVTKDSLGPFVLDETIIALEHLEVWEDTQLHCSSRLFAAGFAMTPARQSRVTRHLALELPTHALPSMRRHDD
jgi:hypothetical protein